MKIVREHINEKFVEDSDPIKDMNIGMYRKRNFNDKKDFLKELMLYIPGILKITKIPKDILLGKGVINDKYFKKIDKFLINNWSFDEISLGDRDCKLFYWNDHLKPLLLKLGYKDV